MRSARRRTVSPSTSTVVPISTSRRSMVRISRTRGTRSSVTASSVNRLAASAGSAEFFEPLVGISPRRTDPPVITNLSMKPFQSQASTRVSTRQTRVSAPQCPLSFAQRLSNAPARCGQTPLRLCPRDAGLAHHDGGSPAHPAPRQQLEGALRRNPRCLRDDAPGAIHKLLVLRLDVDHQVAVNVAQPDERPCGEHVQYQFLRRARLHARNWY